ncbi:hypothetical protein Rhe02_82530 [Rhizocola hellebori]|uniref:Uncharacterized protein n=1 Tax=Rhizocola hellebori TaxID=1392758 RepID=A0A8J3QGJ6_9ACTN|nr:hypothetical protein [Rhizocola hellebori]GIH10186.1 hypothetical protein Rhe02_82530 [Rhizocola hellebori]
MDDRQELQRFAELLMRLVRDQAISNLDVYAAGRIGGAIGEHWKMVLADPACRDAMLELLPEVVDEVLFQLLNALDNGDLPMAWRCEDASYADLYDMGRSEMAGEFLGTDPDGWRVKHSQQRFVHPDAG